MCIFHLFITSFSGNDGCLYMYNRERNEVTLKVYKNALFFLRKCSNRFKHMKMMSVPHATVVWLHNWCSQVVMMDSARYCSHTPSFYGNMPLKGVGFAV